MGLAYANVELRNPRLPDLKALKVRSLADTSALHLCIPEHVALQMQFKELQKREVVTADGKKMLCPYVGPVEISFNGRSCTRAPSFSEMKYFWVRCRWKTWTSSLNLQNVP